MMALRRWHSWPLALLLTLLQAHCGSASTFTVPQLSGSNKYRNDLSSMFSFQYTPPEPSAGPRHIRQNAKPDGFGPSPSSGGSGNVYWVASDPNSPDLQMWPNAAGASGAGQAQQGSMSAYGAARQQQQQVAQQPPQLAQPQLQQQVAPQQLQQMQQQMPMQFQGGGGGYGYGQQQQLGYGGGGQQGQPSPYAAYLDKQINTYPIMIYTLAECIPCQRAKQLLALHYPDVRAHYLELSGNEPWQQQLQIDLQYITGAITFPYIFVCGQYIGGANELFELHESGQLRRMVAQCLKVTPKHF